MPLTESLSLTAVLRGYRDGSFSPCELMGQVIADCNTGDPRIWIERLSADAIMGYVENLAGKTPEDLPLYGVPFAIKDNIDLAGVPTTAGCPEYSYVPEKSATAVQLLIDAGAIPIGKTNLDQFATGLVGVRSPYGVPENPHHPEFIPGGSSSGSAVAVAGGLVSFALGTDTAGSGRVPASLNGLVGVKPTRGLVSCTGVVPACRSLDCVTVFAATTDEAAQVLGVMASEDESDPYSRPWVSPFPAPPVPSEARVGVPRAEQLEFFGNDEARSLFRESVERGRDRGWQIVEIDFGPFLEAARLLYEGPWVAERLAAIEPFLDSQPEVLFPVTRQIIEGGRGLTAVEAFRASYRLEALRHRAAETWTSVDAILTPTLGSPYTVAEVEADPVQLNSNLGYYTNFMNLLDCAATAIPAGRLPGTGMPWGVTLFGPAFCDVFLLELAESFLATEASGRSRSVADLRESYADSRMEVVVCGAHLSGLPLNHQLTSRGATLVEATTTAPVYRMWALPAVGGLPPRPGLVRTEENGASIEVEIWSIPDKNLGSFVAGIAAPLGIGQVELASGREVTGFLCEASAVTEAEEITNLGGWRRYLQGAS